MATNDDVLLILGRMEGKIDAMHARMDRDDIVTSQHAVRLHDLEKDRWVARGGLAVLGLFVGIFTAWVKGELSKII